MDVSLRYWRYRLVQAGLIPRTRFARITCYLLGLDVLLFALQKTLAAFHVSSTYGLTGWVMFLSFVVIIFLFVLAVIWLKARLLWRLRNRLIVTYVFIGVIPVILLITMSLGLLYLFSGQFANFVVTSELQSRLRSLQAMNAGVSSELATRIQKGESATAPSLEGLIARDPSWHDRTVCAWLDQRPLSLCGAKEEVPFAMSFFPQLEFGAIVGDGGKLYLRAATAFPTTQGKLTVISSEPLDRAMLDKIASDLGDVTLYTAYQLHRTIPQEPTQNQDYDLRPGLSAGALPLARNLFDREITFGSPLPVLDWASGKPAASSFLSVQTRPSVLYARLFATLGPWAEPVEYALFLVAIVFGIIELLALWIGTRLTRTVTGAIAHLYVATRHVNRGDLTHRIPVTSNDQLATLATSFNSMMASLQDLLEEQRERQRLQNELLIAQEVQAQLFPKQITQLPSLEVYGFCRPARTVSGDYYDFLTVDPNRLILAVGDVSGKGISAALLMATIHSAVRAYSLEGIPAVRESLVVGASPAKAVTLVSGIDGAEVSPGTLLSLLNHQLYESTPMEKYATLFLAAYHGEEQKLTYSNGGHLPPIILGEDGSVRRLDLGGTVIGLFANQGYEQGAVPFRSGEIFLAYSDGVTEPENDYGEFGEGRLIDLVHQNRHQPLARISDIVTAAVDDWIGANEQPDDVTLVLARAR